MTSLTVSSWQMTWWYLYLATAILIAAGVEQLRIDIYATGGRGWSVLVVDSLVVLAYLAGWLNGRHRVV